MRAKPVVVAWWGKSKNMAVPVLALLVIYCVFAIFGPSSFSTFRNIETIVRQTAIVGVAALGMTMVIIAGGIDLSVGSVVAMATVAVAAMLQGGESPIFAAFGAVFVAALIGWFNGFLITRLKVAPFIVTLGTLLLARGAAKGFAHEQKIDAPLSWLNNLLSVLGPTQHWMVLPVGVWLMLALAVLMALVLRYTRLGRYSFAVGSNEHAARLCGVPVERVRVLGYCICSGFAGVAGVLQFSRLTVGDPTVALGLELDVIAAVVIGGGSLSGGEGSVLGSLVGALIMAVIRSGCSQMGLSNWVQEIVTGIIIVLAVLVDRLRRRK